jgi:PAS domain S-box-containing protein
MSALATETNPEADLNSAILNWLQDLAPQGLLITDQDLRIRTWNRWLEIHSGLKAADIIGTSILEVFPQIDSLRTENIFRQALKGEVQVISSALHGWLFPFPSTVKESHFDRMQQTVRIAPLSANGETVGTITILEDVTERVWQTFLLRQQQERDQFLSWALAYLLKTTEPEHLLNEIFSRLPRVVNAEIYLNCLLNPEEKTMRLHTSGGLTPEQAQIFSNLEAGQHFCGAVASSRKPLVSDNVQQSRAPEAELLKQIGARACASHPLMVGDRLLGTLSVVKTKQDTFAPEEIDFLSTISQYVAIALDRARREKDLHDAQDELRAHAEILEQEVADRTTSLRESLREMESFTYSVAHDLRAPIRFLGGYARALVEDHGHALPQEAQVFVDRIKRSVHKMDELTRDLLRYSHISKEALRMLPVDVEPLAREIIQDQPVLSRPNVVTFQGENIPVLASPVLLRQCLQNLLDNAAKFIPPSVPPSVVVRTELRSATDVDGRHRVRIWVEDNGIGIAPEFRDKVFGIFERVCDPRQYDGTGIGLAIVAKAMHRMNGSFGVESEPGEGSRFWLELECDQVPV